jgi:cyclic-di-AMP phosphodiesterase PgpH
MAVRRMIALARSFVTNSLTDMESGSLLKYLSWFTNRPFLRLLLLFSVSIIALMALVFPVPIRPSAFPVEIGTVSTQDIQAPRTLSYESPIRTEDARSQAENSVAVIYLPADPLITRQQIESLRMGLNYISTVRSDTFATTEQQLMDLAEMDKLQLSRESAEMILLLSDSQWDSVQLESLGVLEQVMRNTIREDNLRDARRNIPTLISFALPQDQASLALEIVTQFVVPNSLRSEDQTNVAREEARRSVSPVMRTFVAGETIVQRGQVVTPLIYEALLQYDLIQPPSDTRSIVAASTLVFLAAAFVLLYFTRRDLAPINDFRSLSLMALTLLIFLFAARLIIPNRAVLPYLFPLPAFGLTIASLFTAEIGLIFSLVLSILAAYGLPNSLDLTLFYILSSLCGILVLGRARRMANFIWAGIAIGAAGTAVITAYRLPETTTDLFGIATLALAAIFNGLASASLALLLQFLFSQILGLTTSLQLLDISRPDHPLLQFIMRNAPGTYQHSLQVANLAEQAAEAIGADALLVRVGALYHDAGKATNPSFFIENQIPGQVNPHDELDPFSSAQIIINHVSDGVKFARKHRLPPRIHDFVREHHGTLMTQYQYAKAIEAADGDAAQVDIETFRYPGPSPQSRETALMMLADGCEARARAELPRDEEALRTVVKKVIDFCQHQGQLDNTALTLRDLNRVAESFVNTLRNTHHPRIKYPELKTQPRPAIHTEEATENTTAQEASTQTIP